MRRDPRRDRPIAVIKESKNIYRLLIDDELWASCEWSRRRNAWCIEDSCCRCLNHVPGILGQERTAPEAIATAKRMIRDETIPAPEYVRARTEGNRK
jgi:hypothetical protein